MNRHDVSPPPIVRRTAAGDRWREMVLAHAAQSRLVRDSAWQSAPDFAPPAVDSFRAGCLRSDDAAIVDALLTDLVNSDTVVDVGAGAGRFALPLAPHVREVVAVEPSAAMRSVLIGDAGRAGLTNLRVVALRWEDVTDITADVVFAAHVVYPLEEIEPFLRRMDAAARRWAAVLVFQEPPLSWLFPFWPRVHGQERLPAPHLPQLLDVLSDLSLGPVELTLLDVAPFPLGPADVARMKLRRRLYVAPGTEADHRLETAMGGLLADRDGVLVPRVENPIRVGLARWHPHG